MQHSILSEISELSACTGRCDRAVYSVSKHNPYRPVRDVISPLIRRADENKTMTAQAPTELLSIQGDIKRRSSRCVLQNRFFRSSVKATEELNS